MADGRRWIVLCCVLGLTVSGSFGMGHLRMIQPFSSQFFEPGTRVSLKCQTEENTTIWWTKDSIDMNCDNTPENCSVKMVEKDGFFGPAFISTLSFKATEEGMYACWLNDTHGVEKLETHLLVKSLVFVSAECSGPTLAGDKFFLSCAAQSQGYHTYSWMFAKQGANTWKLKQYGAELTIEKLSSEDIGTYRCKASSMSTLGIAEVKVRISKEGVFHGDGCVVASQKYHSSSAKTKEDNLINSGTPTIRQTSTTSWGIKRLCIGLALLAILF